MAQNTRFCDISMKVASAMTHVVPTSPLFIMTIFLLAWQCWVTAPKARWSWSSWTFTPCQWQAELLATHFAQATPQSWQRTTSQHGRSEHQLKPGSVLVTEDSLQEFALLYFGYFSWNTLTITPKISECKAIQPPSHLAVNPSVKSRSEWNWTKLNTVPGRSLEVWARGRRRLHTEPAAQQWRQVGADEERTGFQKNMNHHQLSVWAPLFGWVTDPGGWKEEGL